MSIVNLSKRITSDFSAYERCAESSDSLIYVEGNYNTDKNSPDCLALTVGDSWFDKDKYVTIDSKKGIKVKPHTGIVIKTNEKIILPLNVYGILFGAGRNIYRGAFVSNGKIDPGFHGNLRIGYHNAGTETIVLKPGDKLAYAFFLTSESEIPSTVASLVSQEIKAVPALSFKERFGRWLRNNIPNIFSVVSIIIAIATLIVTAIKK